MGIDLNRIEVLTILRVHSCSLVVKVKYLLFRSP